MQVEADFTDREGAIAARRQRDGEALNPEQGFTAPACPCRLR